MIQQPGVGLEAFIHFCKLFLHVTGNDLPGILIGTVLITMDSLSISLSITHSLSLSLCVDLIGASNNGIVMCFQSLGYKIHEYE